MNDLFQQYKTSHEINKPFSIYSKYIEEAGISIYRGEISKESNLVGVEGLDFVESFLSWISKDNQEIYISIIIMPNFLTERLSALEIGFFNSLSTVVFCSNEKNISADELAIYIRNKWGIEFDKSRMYLMFYYTSLLTRKIIPNDFEKNVIYLPALVSSGIFQGKSVLLLDFNNPLQKNVKDYNYIFNCLYN